MKKRFFSLLEVVIGLVLAGILLTALFSILRQTFYTHALVEKMREEKQWEYVTRLRLNQVFSSVENKKSFEFFTDNVSNSKGKALIFTYNNGIDKDPDFCGPVKGTLMLNTKKEVCFITESKSGRMRKEIFLDHVHRFSFSFFDSKSKQWAEEINNTFPPILKIQIEKQTFSFFLPRTIKPISYI